MQELNQYTDYRIYLADYYAEKKSRERGYSYQVMAKTMGFKARDFMHRVINGKKNLSAGGIASVSMGIGHTVDEARYFSALVCFNQAETAQEKEFYYSQLNIKSNKSGIQKSVQKINQSQLELFSEWYHLAIRSLIDMSEFTDDYDWLARQLQPAISKKQARQSVAHLEKLGLIIKDENQIYRVTDKGLSTDNEVDNMSLVRFYNSCSRLSTDALNNLPKKQRNISGVTLGMSRQGYEKVVKELALFRSKMGKIAREDQNADQVYQLQLSLFPFTNPDRGRNQS